MYKVLFFNSKKPVKSRVSKGVVKSPNREWCGYRDNKTDNNKAILLQTLYKINSKLLLKCFKNG